MRSSCGGGIQFLPTAGGGINYKTRKIPAAQAGRGSRKPEEHCPIKKIPAENTQIAGRKTRHNRHPRHFSWLIIKSLPSNPKDCFAYLANNEYLCSLVSAITLKIIND